MVPKEEINKRIAALKEHLEAGGLDGALFLYSVDIYYFSGSRQNAVLWIPLNGDPVLLARKSYLRAIEDSFIEDVRHFPSSRDLPSVFGDDIKKIGLTFDVLPTQHYQFYAKFLHGCEFADISGINRELRSVKSQWELDQMRICGKRLADAFAETPKFIRQGMRELDFAAEFEYLLRKSGLGGFLRIRGFNQEITGIVAAGENAAAPGCFDGPVTGKGFTNSAPYGPSREIIKKNVPVIIDYGGSFDGYIADMTRIFCFGRLDPEIVGAFKVSLAIQSWVVENLKPGAVCEDLFSGASRMAADAGIADNFMGYPGELSKFVGHGVGLELDELPVLAQKFKTPIQEGNVIAIEPKFIFPAKGAIGIENTFAVTERGSEKLTALPDEIVYL